jgi:hypothetical protein
LFTPPQEIPSQLAELGQSGDAFGGANALFSAIAGALLIWAGWLQRKSLIEARNVNTRQTFETTFFELLTLTRELESRFKREIRRSSTTPTRSAPLNRRTKIARSALQLTHNMQVLPELRGNDALSAWAAALMECVHANRAEVKEEDLMRLVTTYFHDQIYVHNSGSFGPYFRTLYQTFKLIDQTEMQFTDKTRYAKIARGMISEDAVLLLAANAAAPVGTRFKIYLRKYGLLEHMNPTYKKQLGRSLLKYIGAKSFLRHDVALNPETLKLFVGSQAYAPNVVPTPSGRPLY